MIKCHRMLSIALALLLLCAPTLGLAAWEGFTLHYAGSSMGRDPITNEAMEMTEELAEECAKQSLLEHYGLKEEEIQAGSFQVEADQKQIFRVQFTIRKEDAGEKTLAELERWFPDRDSCTMVWFISDYNTLVAYGRMGSYLPKTPAPADRMLSEQEASAIAKEAVIEHYRLSEEQIKGLEFTEDAEMIAVDASAKALGWPLPYWRIFLYSIEAGSPVRVAYVDAQSGEVFLFLDDICNG